MHLQIEPMASAILCGRRLWSKPHADAATRSADFEFHTQATDQWQDPVDHLSLGDKSSVPHAIVARACQRAQPNTPDDRKGGGFVDLSRKLTSV